jgi:drug/metabolite transporter (DMT)-like permease
VWGATFILVKAALGGISPILFLTIRFSAATLALSLLFPGAWKGRGSSPGRAASGVTFQMLASGGMVGVFLFTGYLLQTVGLQYTTPPKSAFLTGLSTVMVPLLAMFVYQVRPQVSEVVGVLIATIGMGLMTLESPLGSPLGSAVSNMGWGDLLTVGGALAFSAHIVALGHFSEGAVAGCQAKVGFEFLSVTQVGAAALAGLSLFWWVEPPRIAWHPVVIWAIIVTGLLCTALAFTVQAWAQQYTTSTRTALIYALEPVVAWMTSYCLAGEGLSGRAAAGAALILGGVVLVEMKPLHSRAHPLN